MLQFERPALVRPSLTGKPSCPTPRKTESSWKYWLKPSSSALRKEPSTVHHWLPVPEKPSASETMPRPAPDAAQLTALIRKPRGPSSIGPGKLR